MEASMTYDQCFSQDTIHSDTMSCCFNQMQYSDHIPADNGNRCKELFLHPDCTSVMHNYMLATMLQHNYRLATMLQQRGTAQTGFTLSGVC